MPWNDDLRAFARWFPFAGPFDLASAKEDPATLARSLATSHDLTETEAREGLDDFLYMQELARLATAAPLIDAA